MGFLKSSILSILLVTLHACSGNVTQKATKEPASEATTVSETSPQATAKVLPQFALVDATGKTLDIQSFKGKKIFVNLWATWCPPCRAEMPSIEKLYKTVDTAHVQFVMLSLDKDFETAKQYVQKKGFQMPVFYPAADLPDLFAVNGIPTTFIFNEAGELTEQHEGSEDYNTIAYRKLFGAAK